MIIPRSLFGYVFSTRQIEVLKALANFIESQLSPLEMERVTDSVQLSSSGGVLTIDWSAGSMFHLTLTENITDVNFTGVPSVGEGQAITLMIRQHASSAKTITGWPDEVSWFVDDYEVSSTLDVIDEVGFSWYKTLANGGTVLGKYVKGATPYSGGGG